MGSSLRYVLSLIVVAMLSFPARAEDDEPTLRTVREEAVDKEDWGTALVYTEAMLEHGSLGINELIDLYNEQISLFEKYARAELAKLGPVTDANAEQVLAKARALIREGERGDDVRRRTLAPVVDGPIREAEYQAAFAMWKKVEALHRAKKASEAAVLGHSILTGLQDPSAFLSSISIINRDAAEKHLSVAATYPPELPAGRVLHARVARVFGALLPPELAAEVDRVVKEHQVTFTVSSSGGCKSFDELYPNVFDTRPGGIPVNLNVEFASCGVDVKNWSTEENGAYTYKETVKLTKPVAVKKEVCKQSAYVHGYSTSTDRAAGTVTSSPIVSYTPRCTNQYSIEDKEVEEEVTRTAYERFTVHHAIATGVARGRVVAEWSGGTRARPIDISFRSAEYTRYERKHGASKKFEGGGPVVESEGALFDKVLAEMKPAAGIARQNLSLAHYTRATNGPSGAPREDAFFRSALIQGDVPRPLSRSLQEQYGLPETAATAAISGQPLEAIDYAVQAPLALPVVPQTLIDRARLDTSGDRYSDANTRAMYMAIGAIGGGTATTERSSSRLYALAAHASFNGQLRVAGPLVMGGMFRLGVSADSSLTIFTDFDLSMIAGLQVGRFSATPFFGVGLDYMSDSGADDKPRETQVILPLAVFAHYGGRISYSFAEVPITLDLAYSKHGRTSSVIPESRRLELRGVLALKESSYSLAARYAEYVSAPSPFFQAFTPKDRAARVIWGLVGIAL